MIDRHRFDSHPISRRAAEALKKLGGNSPLTPAVALAMLHLESLPEPLDGYQSELVERATLESLDPQQEVPLAMLVGDYEQLLLDLEATPRSPWAVLRTHLDALEAETEGLDPESLAASLAENLANSLALIYPDLAPSSAPPPG